MASVFRPMRNRKDPKPPSFYAFAPLWQIISRLCASNSLREINVNPIAPKLKVENRCVTQP